MDNRVIDITKEIRHRERMMKLKQWWDDNKQYVAIVAPIVGVLLGKGVRAASKAHSLHMEEKLKDLRCYDASIGHYWELRRKLSNDDWLYINRRKAHGETLGAILRDLNVLK